MSRFRSLLQASVAAARRAVAWNVEALMPPSERLVFQFNSKDELQKWHLYSDSEYGGLSSASLEITSPSSSADTAAAGLRGVFSGHLSQDASACAQWRMKRSGFCGMRSRKFGAAVDYIDLDGYDTIAMRVRGDGRCYISTIYTENWVNHPGQPEDNSWQAFLHAKECGSGEWTIAEIPLERYLPTWRGNVIDSDLEMNPARVVGMSLSVNAEGGIPGTKLGPGDFRLEIDWIKALRTMA